MLCVVALDAGPKVLKELPTNAATAAAVKTVNPTPRTAKTPKHTTKAPIVVKETAPIETDATPVQAQAAGLSRSTSLIPAYPCNQASLEEISLEAMIGTPYTCEVKTKPVTLNETPTEPEVEAAVNAATAVAAAGTTEAACVDVQACDALAASGDPAEDAFDLTTALDALTIGAAAPVGLLRGLPPPASQHLRFADDGSVQERSKHRVFLRGLPEPLGVCTKFD